MIDDTFDIRKGSKILLWLKKEIDLVQCSDNST